MFTFRALQQSFPVPTISEQEIFRILGQMEKQPKFAWLKKTDWQNCKYRYCYAMNVENGVLGAFSMFHPDTLYIAEDYNSDFSQPIHKPGIYERILIDLVRLIAGTIVHELYHRYQYMTMGKILYAVCCLPLVRQVLLEPKATKIGEEADEIIRKMQST